MTAKQDRRQSEIKAMIAYNRKVIYKITDKHKSLSALNWYVGTNSKLTGATSLRATLLSILSYIENLQMWKLSSDGFDFFIDTAKLTYKVRGKSAGRAISNHHVNLLCAIGLLEKVNLNEGDEERVLKPYLNKNNRMNPVSTYKIRRYDSKQLQFMEGRAERLKAVHVTTGNISYGYLIEHSIEDIAKEVYYNNNEYAPFKKRNEWNELEKLIDAIIDLQGYATKSDVKTNSFLQDNEIDRLFTIYKDKMRQKYDYKPPTKEQMKEFSLIAHSWIITHNDTYELIRSGEDLF